MWLRVFGTSDVQPRPAELLEYLHHLGLEVRGQFRGDDLGWFHADLDHAGNTVAVDRYQSDGDDIRADLNTWAAWLETAPDNPHTNQLMQHMIGTTQLFTLQLPPSQRPLGEALCRYLAGRTIGVYQVDDEGFFDADGTLLVPENA